MITKRITQLLETHNITKYKFCRDLGLSNGFLDKEREITTDRYAKILEYFPQINPDWLLTGRGEMLRSDSNNASNNYISNGNFQQGKYINDIKVFVSAIENISKDYQKIIETKDEQIKQLINILEKK